jgi:hypothetical protein
MKRYLRVNMSVTRENCDSNLNTLCAIFKETLSTFLCKAQLLFHFLPKSEKQVEVSEIEKPAD